MAIAAFCPPAVTVLILRSAFRITRLPVRMGRVCGAAFTICVLHFPIVVLLDIVLSHGAANVYVEYVFATVASVSLAYGCHGLLIARSPSLSLLLTGRRLARG